MKKFRARDGTDRLWFETWEIEAICDEELRKSNLAPSPENPIVEIERLVEQHLRAQLDLTAPLPAGVLGQTSFDRTGPIVVAVNRELTEEMEELATTGSLGRWRATLAHEAGHVILHRHLYYIDPRQGQLLETHAEAPTLMRCLSRDVSFASGSSDWREVQANQAMAALLMPQDLFLQLAKKLCGEQSFGATRKIQQDSPLATSLTKSMADAFAVSRTAAAIRLSTLGLVVPSEAAQLQS